MFSGLGDADLRLGYAEIGLGYVKNRLGAAAKNTWHQRVLSAENQNPTNFRRQPPPVPPPPRVRLVFRPPLAAYRS